MPLPNEILEHIPEEYRDNETLNRFNEVGDLAKSYVELRNKQGRSITVPGKDAPESDRKQFLESLINNAPELMMKPDFSEEGQEEEFWRTLGKPESDDKYAVPEGIDFPDEVINKMRKFAYDSNQTPQQFQTWVKKMHEDHAQTQEAMSSAIEEETKELRNQWGVTFDDRVRQAEKIHQQFFEGKDFGTLRPTEIKALYEISAALTGKAAPAAHQEPGSTTGMTPEEARDRVEEIMRKVHDPKSELSHQERMRLIQKTIELKKKYIPEFRQAS